MSIGSMTYAWTSRQLPKSINLLDTPISSYFDDALLQEKFIFQSNKFLTTHMCLTYLRKKSESSHCEKKAKERKRRKKKYKKLTEDFIIRAYMHTRYVWNGNVKNLEDERWWKSHALYISIWFAFESTWLSCVRCTCCYHE